LMPRARGGQEFKSDGMQITMVRSVAEAISMALEHGDR
jgi:hypothetical protein